MATTRKGTTAAKAEPVKVELEYGKYADKAPTALQTRYVDWIIEKTGVDVDAMEDPFAEGVRLGTALRMIYQASPENKAATAELRDAGAEEREAREAKRVEREAEREAKAQAKEAAKATREAAAAERAAGKKAPAKKAPAKKAAAAPAEKPATTKVTPIKSARAAARRRTEGAAAAF